jgi:hypothetical protein
MAMKPGRTLVTAALAVFVTVPTFAQNPAPQAVPPAARQRLTPEQRQQRRAARVSRALKRLDADGNGAISRQEWTRRAEAFDRIDANKDGQITPDELRTARRGRSRRIR